MNLPIQRRLAAAAGGKPSAEHKRFQQLLAQIDHARQHLQTWQQQLPLFAQAHSAQVQPLLAALAASRRGLAFELEALRADRRWTKAERETMSEMIETVSETLLNGADAADPELKQLHDRHAEVPYDAQDALALASMQAMFEEVGGFDFGDAPIDSADDLLRRAQAQVAQEMAADEMAAGARSRAEAHARQRKPARKTAAQKRAADEAHRASQTVREVYRKLAGALHPDRIPADATPDERAARTAQMQRANAAYEAGDLLALLELQLQIEQIDVAHAAGVAAEQVRHFNKVLAVQLRELQAEVDERQEAFCASYGIWTERRIDPDKLGVLLKEQAREVAAAQLLADMQRRALAGGPVQVKRMLKQWRIQQRLADEDEGFFF